MIRSTQLMTAVLGLSSVLADLNPDLNTVDEAEARDDVITAPDHGYGHGHAHAHDHAPNSLAEESDPTAAGYYNQYYDPAYAQNYYQKYDDVPKIKSQRVVNYIFIISATRTLTISWVIATQTTLMMSSWRSKEVAPPPPTSSPSSPPSPCPSLRP